MCIFVSQPWDDHFQQSLRNCRMQEVISSVLHQCWAHILSFCTIVEPLIDTGTCVTDYNSYFQQHILWLELYCWDGQVVFDPIARQVCHHHLASSECYTIKLKSLRNRGPNKSFGICLFELSSNNCVQRGKLEFHSQDHSASCTKLKLPPTRFFLGEFVANAEKLCLPT